ncbi:Metalloendopeptidase [Aphelenchoides bicaudatus]|nr:Metalloendopeptidase [Aphelenchoides bicaudatus]
MLLAILLVFGSVSAMPVKKANKLMDAWHSEFSKDIAISESQKLIQTHQKLFVVDGEQHRWPGSVVPYIMSNKHTTEEKEKIRHAMNVIEKVSCFRFVEKKPEHRDYLNIEPGETIQAAVGRQGGPQEVSLPGWLGVVEHIAVHELLHSLGADHEHQRGDRDSFIDVHTENIEPDMQWVFKKEPWQLKFPYDLLN